MTAMVLSRTGSRANGGLTARNRGWRRTRERVGRRLQLAAARGLTANPGRREAGRIGDRGGDTESRGKGLPGGMRRCRRRDSDRVGFVVAALVKRNKVGTLCCVPRSTVHRGRGQWGVFFFTHEGQGGRDTAVRQARLCVSESSGSFGSSVGFSTSKRTFRPLGQPNKLFPDTGLGV